jgi:RimJ/RimL family protein N-acetyltransferase
MTVVLRPFRPDERKQALAAWRAFGGRAGDENARRRFLRRLEHSGTLHRGILDLAVEADGRLVGDVQARQPRYALPAGAFELGVQIWDPADRRRGFGREAVAQLTALLFTEHGAARVQASTSVDNVATRRLLESLGFAEEGVLRAFWPREDGSREDYVLYAVTRADWAARRRRR